MPLQEIASVANAVAPKARIAIDRWDWVTRNEVLKPFDLSEESEKAASQTVLTSRQKIDLKLDSESPWKLKLAQVCVRESLGRSHPRRARKTRGGIAGADTFAIHQHRAPENRGAQSFSGRRPFS